MNTDGNSDQAAENTGRFSDEDTSCPTEAAQAKPCETDQRHTAGARFVHLWLNIGSGRSARSHTRNSPGRHQNAESGPAPTAES